MVDIDLAILGQGTGVRPVGAQCAPLSIFVRAARFIVGRSAVLQSFLDRPRIYGTTGFARYEAAARQNLTRALAAILHRGSA